MIILIFFASLASIKSRFLALRACTVSAPVVPIFCAFLAKNTTRFCAFIAHFGEGRDSNDDFRETMISLVDLIVILAVLVFCGGGCSVQIL